MESKCTAIFGPADHPAALLALVAFAILAVAWPLENVPACVLAAVMVVVAAGITIRAHFGQHVARWHDQAAEQPGAAHGRDQRHNAKPHRADRQNDAWPIRAATARARLRTNAFAKGVV